MSKIFITGSADGLGFLAGKQFLETGNSVVFHARNENRKNEIINKIPAAEVLVADLSNMDDVKNLAVKANKFGNFDAVIHNAGVYSASAKEIFSVNVLAPYILTSLMEKPKRLVYLSSGMHLSGKLDFENFKKGNISYSDSKLYVVMFANAVARKWRDVFSNSLNPGWVPTKMGGKGAPDDLQKGFETQIWLATSEDETAKVSGQYFFHQKSDRYHPDAGNIGFQDEFLKICEEISWVSFPN